MFNPFTTPLTLTAAASPPAGSGKNGHFNLPSKVNAGVNANYPVAPGTTVDSVLFPNYSMNEFQGQLPHYAGRSGVEYNNTIGLKPSHSYSISAGPGDTDVSVPRDVGSVPAPNHFVRVTGPVTGANNGFSGYIQKLHTINPNVAGPVTGGEDYSIKLGASYWAAQTALTSNAAIAAALVSAV